MIKLTSGVETVLEWIFSDFMVSGLTVPSPPCWGGSSKSLLSTSPERGLEVPLYSLA